MVNHLKSKGYGKRGESNARREAQAKRVAEIYEQRTGAARTIVVAGDFNDTRRAPRWRHCSKKPTSKTPAELPGWAWGEREGTYGGGKKTKIDYLLLSPALREGQSRRGQPQGRLARPPEPRTLGQMLPTLKEPEEAASDHAAVWVELEL